MIHVIVVLAVAVLLSLGDGFVGWAVDRSGSQLAIMSPVQGAVIKGGFRRSAVCVVEGY